MDTLAAIHQRVSVRSYADQTVDPALLARLLEFAQDVAPLSDVPPRLALISGHDTVERVLTFMVGSYGLIQNAPHLLAGILPEEKERARVDLGYVLEQVVLEATRLGLGTCWITGSYDRGRAEEVLELAEREVVAAVCALGHPTEKGLGRLHTTVVRRLAGGHTRKPLDNIVFSQHWGESWSAESADPGIVSVLEYARLAPSAHNGQPWRFMVGEGELALAIVKPRFIDAGIVMSHVSVAAAAADVDGEWKLRLRNDAIATHYRIPNGAIPVATFRFSGA